MMPPRPGIILFLFYAIMSREIFQNFTKKVSNVIETSFVFLGMHGMPPGPPGHGHPGMPGPPMPPPPPPPPSLFPPPPPPPSSGAGWGPPPPPRPPVSLLILYYLIYSPLSAKNMLHLFFNFGFFTLANTIIAVKNCRLFLLGCFSSLNQGASTYYVISQGGEG